jgi:predicted helicase
LNDDYLKFLRWAVWKVVEQPGGARHGVVAYVTNHAFINNRIHRGVRRALLDAFDDIFVFNLQGNQRLWVKGIVDEKVFPDVQQGVALTVLVRREIERTGPTKVRYREMRGTRDEKYAASSVVGLASDGWVDVTPRAPFWSFAAASSEPGYETWPSVREIFPIGVSGVKTERDDLLSDVSRDQLAERMRVVTDKGLATETLSERLGIVDSKRWILANERSRFADYEERREIRWLYRLFDMRWLYWDTAMIGQPGVRVMRHLLPIPMGFGGGQRVALVVQRARPIATIATVARGPATAHVTGNWCHVYPLRLSDATTEESVLPSTGDWRENLAPAVAARLEREFGWRPSVEDVAWYAFGILSAPAYRARFAAALSIDHPRIPFTTDVGTFSRMVELGRELGQAHLLESSVSPDIRFVGEGDGVVGDVRHDAAGESVWINSGQAFTGVAVDAWAWGQGFRPLEHFLDDRRRRRLDAEQIAGFQSAIHAVRECIRLEPLLDGALQTVVDTAS